MITNWIKYQQDHKAKWFEKIYMIEKKLKLERWNLSFWVYVQNFETHRHFDAQKCWNLSSWDYVYFFQIIFLHFTNLYTFIFKNIDPDHL